MRAVPLIRAVSSASIVRLLASIGAPVARSWERAGLPPVALGVLAGVGHYFVTIAYSQAPAATIAPFNYMQLLGAAILGYLLFDSIPDFWTWVGTAVIVSSGLYLDHAERRRWRRNTIKK